MRRAGAGGPPPNARATMLTPSPATNCATASGDAGDGAHNTASASRACVEEGRAWAAAANSAYQGKAFFEDATRDYRRLWETLPGATPEGALGAWQAFWAARTASYLGAAFRAAANWAAH